MSRTPQKVICFCNKCEANTVHKLTIRSPKQDRIEYACDECGNTKYFQKK